MSAPFIVVIPVALLAIVLLLGFLGCHTNTSLPPPTNFTTYSGSTVLPTPGLVAYWALGEASGPTAVNRHQPGVNNGTYAQAGFMPDAVAQSAAAPGVLIYGVSGLLAGDL